jgi:hypothetical protein
MDLNFGGSLVQDRFIPSESRDVSRCSIKTVVLTEKVHSYRVESVVYINITGFETPPSFPELSCWNIRKR